MCTKLLKDLDLGFLALLWCLHGTHAMVLELDSNTGVGIELQSWCLYWIMTLKMHPQKTKS
jgi:hypothetical protein